MSSQNSSPVPSDSERLHGALSPSSRNELRHNEPPFKLPMKTARLHDRSPSKSLSGVLPPSQQPKNPPKKTKGKNMDRLGNAHVEYCAQSEEDEVDGYLVSRRALQTKAVLRSMDTEVMDTEGLDLDAQIEYWSGQLASAQAVANTNFDAINKLNNELGWVDEKMDHNAGKFHGVDKNLEQQLNQSDATTRKLIVSNERNYKIANAALERSAMLEDQLKKLSNAGQPNTKPAVLDIRQSRDTAGPASAPSNRATTSQVGYGVPPPIKHSQILSNTNTSTIGHLGGPRPSEPPKNFNAVMPEEERRARSYGARKLPGNKSMPASGAQNYKASAPPPREEAQMPPEIPLKDETLPFASFLCATCFSKSSAPCAAAQHIWKHRIGFKKENSYHVGWMLLHFWGHIDRKIHRGIYEDLYKYMPIADLQSVWAHQLERMKAGNYAHLRQNQDQVRRYGKPYSDKWIGMSELHAEKQTKGPGEGPTPLPPQPRGDRQYQHDRQQFNDVSWYTHATRESDMLIVNTGMNYHDTEAMDRETRERMEMRVMVADVSNLTTSLLIRRRRI